MRTSTAYRYGQDELQREGEEEAKALVQKKNHNRRRNGCDTLNFFACPSFSACYGPPFLYHNLSALASCLVQIICSKWKPAQRHVTLLDWMLECGLYF
jgi:hypothetical protein